MTKLDAGLNDLRDATLMVQGAELTVPIHYNDAPSPPARRSGGAQPAIALTSPQQNEACAVWNSPQRLIHFSPLYAASLIALPSTRMRAGHWLKRVPSFETFTIICCSITTSCPRRFPVIMKL